MTGEKTPITPVFLLFWQNTACYLKVSYGIMNQIICESLVICCKRGGGQVAFSQEEFDIMVCQLLYSEPVCFDMLCHIADKTLRRAVHRWCRDDDCLCGRGYENDILQQTHLHLIKSAVGGFLLRDSEDGSVNYDPAGFKNWMFTVAKNVKRDFADRVRGRDYRTESLETSAAQNVPAASPEETRERIETLKQALSLALSADASVYKVLTWLAQFVFMLDSDLTKIKSNERLVDLFQDKTLYEMYDMVMSASGRIPWLQITKEQNERLLTALGKPWDGNKVYGEVTYQTFFMKQNGEKSGKKSISDWVNRINTFIKRKMDEQNGEEKLRKPAPRNRSGKRRGADGPSDG